MVFPDAVWLAPLIASGAGSDDVATRKIAGLLSLCQKLPRRLHLCITNKRDVAELHPELFDVQLMLKQCFRIVRIFVRDSVISSPVKLEGSIAQHIVAIINHDARCASRGVKRQNHLGSLCTRQAR